MTAPEREEVMKKLLIDTLAALPYGLPAISWTALFYEIAVTCSKFNFVDLEGFSARPPPGRCIVKLLTGLHCAG